MPTVITLQSVATGAETGQAVPLVATVNPTGTPHQLKAAQSETITGTVEFFIDSPHPILLGKVALNTNDQSSNSLFSAIESSFGNSNQQGAFSVKDSAYISTNALKKLGPYQLEARFVPANGDLPGQHLGPQDRHDHAPDAGRPHRHEPPGPGERRDGGGRPAGRDRPEPRQ